MHWLSSERIRASPSIHGMKAIISACLARPVATSASFTLLMVLAAVAYVRLPVALLPDLSYPGLVVWTRYPDVPPERVERAVTEPIEEAVAGTVGLQRITARTLLGGSLVHLEFGWNTNLDLALLEVREGLDQLGNHLAGGSIQTDDLAPGSQRTPDHDRGTAVCGREDLRWSAGSGGAETCWP